MSNEPSIEEIRKNYQRLPDKKLLELASYDATGLRPEALQALKEEIKVRGLDKGLNAAIDVQTKGLNPAELSALVSIVRKTPCPHSQSKNKALNAIQVNAVKSFIFLTTSSRKTVIGCEDCLLKINNKAIITTSLLGWWAIPFGLFRTPVAIFKNLQNSEKAKSIETTDVLNSFVLSHGGALVKIGNNESELLTFISDATS